MEAGKHVFVEKPLALNGADVEAIEKVFNDQDGRCHLMVGYNRRFAPHTMIIKELLEPIDGPKVFVATMNAGAVPSIIGLKIHVLAAEELLERLAIILILCAIW